MRLQKLSAGRRARRGFTLVEIMIVVLIIAVLLNIAAPQLVRARNSAQARSCIANLHSINAAKEAWALQNNKPAAATPLQSDIQPYLNRLSAPACPSGGTYSINNLSTLPTCSYGGAGGNIPPHQF